MWQWPIGWEGGPETSVNNYHTTPCNHPEDHRLHQHRGGSLTSRLYLAADDYVFMCSSQQTAIVSVNSIKWHLQHTDWTFCVRCETHCYAARLFTRPSSRTVTNCVSLVHSALPSQDTNTAAYIHDPVLWISCTVGELTAPSCWVGTVLKAPFPNSTSPPPLPNQSFLDDTRSTSSVMVQTAGYSPRHLGTAEMTGGSQRGLRFLLYQSHCTENVGKHVES
jgi:hypothetical protein